MAQEEKRQKRAGKNGKSAPRDWQIGTGIMRLPLPRIAASQGIL
jgi:hypothetical protein